ncbi:hypothetical protein AA637_12905 [Cyanobacterium sp. HL-69]|nr:hypothetical protein AA637_12905 [Cyanobacterium sp. HL-69]
MFNEWKLVGSALPYVIEREKNQQLMATPEK